MGGMALTVNNCTVYGHSDFTAKEKINIHSEFLAAGNSEVHIYPSETFPDCGDYSDFPLQKQSKPVALTSENYDNNPEKEIELNFRKSENGISIYPNPSHGIFSIKLTDMHENDVIKSIKVYDALGIEIYFNIINDKSFKLNLSSNSKGIYYLLVTDSEKNYNQKIIIN